MKTRVIAILVSGFVLFGLLIAVHYFLVEPMHASRDAALKIQPGMTRSQVVDTLGVLYDDFRPGQNKSVDTAISQMKNAGAITDLACWSVAYSWDRFWVAYDHHDIVVATYLETNAT